MLTLSRERRRDSQPYRGDAAPPRSLPCSRTALAVESAPLAPGALVPAGGAVRLSALRDDIARIERATLSGAGLSPAVPLGLSAIDDALPWHGLPGGAVPEIAAADTGAGLAFAAYMLGRFKAAAPRERRPILWCLPLPGLYETGNLYAPGLSAFGVDPGAVLFARGRRPRDVLWSVEEGLRSGAVAAVVGEVPTTDLTASRRLALAARERGTPLFLLASAAAPDAGSAALTRWRVGSAPVPRPHARPTQPYGAAWRLDLLRCRGGLPRGWLVAWDHVAGDRASSRSPPDPHAWDQTSSDRTPTGHTSTQGRPRDASHSLHLVAAFSDRPLASSGARAPRAESVRALAG